MEQSVKIHKRKSKNLVDPVDLVSEKSLEKVYTIFGRVSTLTKSFTCIPICIRISKCLFLLTSGKQILNSATSFSRGEGFKLYQKDIFFHFPNN